MYGYPDWTNDSRECACSCCTWSVSLMVDRQSVVFFLFWVKTSFKIERYINVLSLEDVFVQGQAVRKKKLISSYNRNCKTVTKACFIYLFYLCAFFYVLLVKCEYRLWTLFYNFMKLLPYSWIKLGTNYFYFFRVTTITIFCKYSEYNNYVLLL